ncbi:vitamin B12 ABC transporter permease BtuC, partial [Kluyvera cryocrescens]
MQLYVHQQQRRNRRWLVALTLVLLLMLGIGLCAGDQWIAPGEWLSAKGQLFIWQIRLPRTLAVMLVRIAPATRQPA